MTSLFDIYHASRSVYKQFIRCMWDAPRVCAYVRTMCACEYCDTPSVCLSLAFFVYIGWLAAYSSYSNSMWGQRFFKSFECFIFFATVVYGKVSTACDTHPHRTRLANTACRLCFDKHTVTAQYSTLYWNAAKNDHPQPAKQQQWWRQRQQHLEPFTIAWYICQCWARFKKPTHVCSHTHSHNTYAFNCGGLDSSRKYTYRIRKVGYAMVWLVTFIEVS